MTTRVEHMLALKAAWEKAQAGPPTEAALKNYEAAPKGPCRTRRALSSKSAFR